MEKEAILKKINQLNPHWSDSTAPKPNFSYKRKLFYTALDYLESRFIITIEGLRRTGKSVLQKQLSQEFAKKYNISGTSIFTFSFESEDSFELLSPKELSDVLETYFEQILRCHPALTKSKILIALDEVQNVKGWQSVIKTFYDLNPDIKFIITGSSSLFLNNASESLVGRSIDYKLDPLDFEEFLQIIGYNGSKIQFAKNLEDLCNMPAISISSDIIKIFEDFLLIGGFPDSAKMYAQNFSTDQIQQFIRTTIIDKVINLDLRKYFKLDSNYGDRRLFEICAKKSSSFFELSNLAQEVGMSRITIKKHLEIFDKSSLIYSLNKYDRKLRREIRSTKKYYVTSPCLMYSTLFIESIEDKSFLGLAAETYAFNKLRNYAKKIYVDHAGGQKEIDFYLPLDNLIIESKYSTNTKSKEFNYLRSKSKNSKDQPLILSYNNWQLHNIRARPLLLL